MEPSTRGFSPEQIATGTLEDGREIIVLYVKEYSEQLKRVRLSGQIGYFYTWSHMAETDSFVLFIYWNNDEEAAIVFPPKQHNIVESMKAPKLLIIAALPINSLMKSPSRRVWTLLIWRGLLSAWPMLFIRRVVKCPNCSNFEKIH